MTKKLVALGLQPRQTFTQPDNPFTDRSQFARAGEQCRIIQRLSLSQAINHLLDALHRADDHAGKQQNQRQAQQKQNQRLPAEELPALGDLLL